MAMMGSLPDEITDLFSGLSYMTKIGQCASCVLAERVLEFNGERTKLGLRCMKAR